MVLLGERRVSGSLCRFCMHRPILCLICACADAWSCRMLFTDVVHNLTSVLRRAGAHQRGQGALVGHMAHQFVSGFVRRHGTRLGAHPERAGHEVRAAWGTSGVVVACQEGPGYVWCIVCACGALWVCGYVITGLACVQEGV